MMNKIPLPRFTHRGLHLSQLPIYVQIGLKKCSV